MGLEKSANLKAHRQDAVYIALFARVNGLAAILTALAVGKARSSSDLGKSLLLSDLRSMQGLGSRQILIFRVGLGPRAQRNHGQGQDEQKAQNDDANAGQHHFLDGGREAIFHAGGDLPAEGLSLLIQAGTHFDQSLRGCLLHQLRFLSEQACSELLIRD
ncbi:hypothetical protein [Deinococcus aquatilis]|uniref:hypothetical protein n=1 Tax=Deinococcus aquatilis TaxID=519440 RepID=UPI0012FA78A5|nr:hypothetical protein [Deinococcus aquatilis]